MAEIHPWDGLILREQLEAMSRALDELPSGTQFDVLKRAVNHILFIRRDVTSLTADTWRALESVWQLLRDLAEAGEWPLLLTEMVIGRGKDPEKVARRLERCIRIRQLRNGRERIVLHPKTELVDYTEHIEKEVAVDRKSPRRVWPPLEGIIVDVECGLGGVPNSLVLVVDNGKIGGTRKKISLKQVTRIVVEKEESQKA